MHHIGLRSEHSHSHDLNWRQKLKEEEEGPLGKLVITENIDSHFASKHFMFVYWCMGS